MAQLNPPLGRAELCISVGLGGCGVAECGRLPLVTAKVALFAVNVEVSVLRGWVDEGLAISLLAGAAYGMMLASS